MWNDVSHLHERPIKQGYTILIFFLFSNFRRKGKEQKNEEKEERKMKRNHKLYKWYENVFNFL